MSVDAETKRALHALADHDFGGNLSALVTEFAEDAKRRMAAGEFLRSHRVPKLTSREAVRLEAEIEREVASARRKRRHKAA